MSYAVVQQIYKTEKVENTNYNICMFACMHVCVYVCVCVCVCVCVSMTLQHLLC
jgi:hypothetical protein